MLTDDEKMLLVEALDCGIDLRRRDRPHVPLAPEYAAMYRSIAEKLGLGVLVIPEEAVRGET